jgi:hypothetical protein
MSDSETTIRRGWAVVAVAMLIVTCWVWYVLIVYANGGDRYDEQANFFLRGLTLMAFLLAFAKAVRVLP